MNRNYLLDTDLKLLGEEITSDTLISSATAIDMSLLEIFTYYTNFNSSQLLFTSSISYDYENFTFSDLCLNVTYFSSSRCKSFQLAGFASGLNYIIEYNLESIKLILNTIQSTSSSDKSSFLSNNLYKELRISSIYVVLFSINKYLINFVGLQVSENQFLINIKVILFICFLITVMFIYLVIWRTYISNLGLEVFINSY